MRLRPYKKCDDKYIINWFDDEEISNVECWRL